MHDLLKPPSQVYTQAFVKDRPHTTTKIKGWTKLSFQEDEPTLFGNRTDYCVYTHPAKQLSITFKLKDHEVNLEIYAKDHCVERVERLAPKLQAVGNKRPDLVTVAALPPLSSFEQNTYVLVNSSTGLSLYFANTEHQCFTPFTPNIHGDTDGSVFRACLKSLAEAKSKNDEATIDTVIERLIATNSRLSDNPRWSRPIVNVQQEKSNPVKTQDGVQYTIAKSDETRTIYIETKGDSSSYTKLINSMNDIKAELGIPAEIKDELISMIVRVKKDFLKYQVSLLATLTVPAQNKTTKDEKVMSLLHYELKEALQPEYTLMHTIGWLIDRNELYAAMAIVRPLIISSIYRSSNGSIEDAYLYILCHDRLLLMNEKTRITEEIALLKNHSNNGQRFKGKIAKLTRNLSYIEQAEKATPLAPQSTSVGVLVLLSKDTPPSTGNINTNSLTAGASVK